MPAPTWTLLLVFAALVGCVGQRDLVPQNGGSGGGGVSGSAGAAGGTSSTPIAGACAVPAGQIVPYKTVTELETLVVGDWLRCSGSAYPAAFGVGIRISPDHFWYALVMDDAGALQPISAGFDGYGQWTTGEVSTDRIQFNLLRITSGGAGGFLTFTDTGQMRMDWGGVSADYVRLSRDLPATGGGGSSGSDGGGAGGTVSVPGPGDCAAADGHVVPYSTLADLELLILGDWLRCRGNAFPSFGVGLRISADHTWSSLARDDTGALQPITTGFDGYGTWTAGEVGAGQFQFNLLRPTGGGAGYFPVFTDTGQMRTDFGTAVSDYVRLAPAP